MERQSQWLYYPLPKLPIKRDIKIIDGIIFASFAHLQDVADRYSIIFRQRDIAYPMDVCHTLQGLPYYMQNSFPIRLKNPVLFLYCKIFPRIFISLNPEISHE